MPLRPDAGGLPNSLTDTETREYPAEQIVVVELAGDFRQRVLHLQQFLGHQLAGCVFFELLPGQVEMLARSGEALKMPAPGRDRAFWRWFVTEYRLQMVTQRFDTVAFERGDVTGPAGSPVRSILFLTTV